MRGLWWRRLAEVVLVVALAVFAGWVFGRAPAKQAGDEANWVGTARFFLVLFVRHDISAESWPDSYWTRTQPMIPRYIMGGWLWARGYQYEHLDPNFDHRRKWFSNVDEGRAPDQATLTETRVPMRGLAALSAVLVYGVVRVLAGPLGGAAGALLFIGSPYLRLHLVRAMGEPPFMAFLLATLLVCLLAITHRHRGWLGWRGALLAGTLLGLAFASKLTAIIAMVGVVCWGIWAAVGPMLQARLTPRQPGTDIISASVGGPVRRLGPLRGPFAWALATVAVALLVFVLTNPFLYRETASRMLLLFQNRQYEMALQAEVDPSRAVPELSQRATRVLKHSLLEDTWADTTLRWPLDVVFVVVGLGWLLWRGVRWQPGPESLLLLWVFGYFAGVSLGLGYVLDHYFVPTATLATVVAGVGVGWTATLVWRTLAHLTHLRRPSDSHAEAAPARPFSAA